MNFKVAIIENEQRAYENLHNAIIRYESEHKENTFKVNYYSDASSFLVDYHMQYDLLLFDIEMDGINGISAAKKVREIDADVMIVFVTNIAKYAVESYNIRAYDYILKPINYHLFCMKFKSICNTLEHTSRGEFINISTRFGVRKIMVEDIMYLEVVNHELIFHCTKGDYSIFATLKEMQEKLRPYHFVRCNVCYIVNLNYVTELDNDTVVLKEHKLKISRSRKNEFYNEFTKFIGGSV